MHILSSYNRSEFLAVPQLIRLAYVRVDNGFEVTLLVKCSTIISKYILLGVRMQLAFTMLKDRLLCALRICDDGDDSSILWSVVEREEELDGIRGLARGEPLKAFLFNELAVNVAWNDLATPISLDRLLVWADSASLGRADYFALRSIASPLLECLGGSRIDDDKWLVLEVGGRSDWKAIHNHFITASTSSSMINLFDTDEGNQQEQMGIWLTDNLQPSGTYHSPQIPKGSGTRELTDILLSYDFGSTLIESKTFSILSRGRLPDRTKLKHGVSAHIDKAFTQLRGAIRSLKSGALVTSSNGDVLDVEREHPAHCIALIPDLDLIEDPARYGKAFIRSFLQSTGGIPHLLDISELLRIVQAAEMIAARGKTITPMMAFDYYLMERFQKAVESDSLCIEVLLRFDDEKAPLD